MSQKVRVRFTGSFEIDLPDDIGTTLKAYDGSDPKPEIINEWEECIVGGTPGYCYQVEVTDIS